MILTPHFDANEVTFSSAALRLGIDNSLPYDLEPNVAKAALGMEQVRAILGGQPVRVDSWYRCPQLNRVVGGAAKSAHMWGWAVDFTCTDFGPPREIVKVLVAANLDFDQLIQEGTWVHVSFDSQLRQELLTAHFTSSGTTYTPGLS